jgi:predicted dinucleotide-binding enzyme
MSYSIIGSGHIGSAVARQFARKGIERGRRTPSALRFGQ